VLTVEPSDDSQEQSSSGGFVAIVFVVLNILLQGTSGLSGFPRLILHSNNN
jgi:hypothetical protein